MAGQLLVESWRAPIKRAFLRASVAGGGVPAFRGKTSRLVSTGLDTHNYPVVLRNIMRSPVVSGAVQAPVIAAHLAVDAAGFTPHVVQRGQMGGGGVGGRALGGGAAGLSDDGHVGIT